MGRSKTTKGNETRILRDRKAAGGVRDLEYYHDDIVTPRARRACTRLDNRLRYSCRINNNNMRSGRT